MPRIAPNLFGIAFGLTALAEVWRAAELVLGVPVQVPYALFILAAVVLLVLTGGYVAQGASSMLADLHDPVLQPFLSLPPIVAMMLSAALASVAFAAGRVLVVIFLAVTVAFGGWLMGHWVMLDLTHENFHPGYFLPTVAGGALGAVAAAEVHLQGIAVAAFGIGLISWLLLGSTVLNRLFFHRALPAVVLPTLAIEAAPPAVVGVAYLAISHDTLGPFAYALGGYTVLMALMQLRFPPMYLHLRFSVGTWSFTFSYGIVGLFALDWIRLTHVVDRTGWSSAVLALITILIGGIGVRTIVAIARGQFLPATKSERN